jgi:hypothetical protein
MKSPRTTTLCPSCQRPGTIDVDLLPDGYGSWVHPFSCYRQLADHSIAPWPTWSELQSSDPESAADDDQTGVRR